MNPIALANLTFKGISVRGDKGTKPASVLFDTGATVSIISRALAEQVANIVDADKPFSLSVADGNKISIDKMAFATVDLGGRMLTDQFYVMDSSVADLILGMSTLRKYQVRIDAGADHVFASVTEAKPEVSKVKDFFKKLFVAIGATASEDDIDEDKAVAIVKDRLAAIQEESRKEATPKKAAAAQIYAIPPKVLKALGLPEDADESDAISQAALLARPAERVPVEVYNDLNNQIREREIQDLVAKACAAGDDEMAAKLYPHEREWAIEFARENGLDSARKFVKNRHKVLAIMDRLPGKKKDDLVIDDLQASINAQLKVDTETFKKYNTPAH